MPYPTKPLECFSLAKELRARHYRDIMAAREQGKLLVSGGVVGPWELLEGFGPIEFFEGEPYGAAVAAEPELAAASNEATDAHGYGRDVCPYARSYWGSMFLNRSPWGAFPRPDFAVQYHHSHCGTNDKWFRVLSEHLGVPYYVMDYPRLRPADGALTDAQVERYTGYLTVQYHQFIEWAEKVTDRKYDDGRLIQALVHKRRSQQLWGEICRMQQAVPAPLNLRTLYALMAPRVSWGTRAEGVSYLAQLRDEVESRVAGGIAGQAEERGRFLHDFVAPYIAMDIMKHIESYGAALVVSLYVCNWGGGIQDDGQWGLVPAFETLGGRPPRDREEALRDIAHWDLKRDCWLRMFSCQVKVDTAIEFVERWKCNGAIYHLNRGDVGGMLGILNARLALKERGIPTLLYEASATDRRDVDIVKVKDQIDAYMESLGLRKL
ncbi:MAG: 2-hydroxyacyl-CoA dehydratase [Chloroflexi bacterium]|nr:2-hydroxyacyl-CoA dehydratase [Chloroflexota bacterium]